METRDAPNDIMNKWASTFVSNSKVELMADSKLGTGKHTHPSAKHRGREDDNEYLLNVFYELNSVEVTLNMI